MKKLWFCIFCIFLVGFVGMVLRPRFPREHGTGKPTQGDPIREKIAAMAPEEKAGQLMLVGMEGTEPSAAFQKELQENHYGGVILFDRNMKDPNQVKALNSRLQDLARPEPLLIGVDEEGGQVARMKDQLPALAENGSNAMMVVTGAYAPGIITGLISAAIICATMSSADSNLLCMSTMIINDIYPGFGGKKKLEDKQVIFYTRLCNVIAALIAMGISMFGVSLVAMNTFAFGIRCAGPFAAYGLGLAVPKATKNSGMISIFTGTIAFVVWQLLSNGGTLWFMMPVVFGSLVSVITFYVVNLIEWKRGVPAAPSAYAVEEAK